MKITEYGSKGKKYLVILQINVYYVSIKIFYDLVK